MTAIPNPTRTLVTLIDEAHEDAREPPRPHMGVSTLGHSCDRWLWLSFRWAVAEKTPGRVLRLFRRGHHEEATVIADLELAGVVFDYPPAGEQHRVDFDGHVSGSMDGIITSGVLGAEKTRHILEIKTHSKKSFDDLERHGVEKSKPMHFVQMQVYMLGKDIERALYVAVCKDDDRLHIERVRLDKAVAEKAVARGKRLAIVDEQPPPLSTDPSWYECKWCAAHSWCHGGKGITARNCRTCAHSTAMPDSTWRCEKHNADNIPLEYQRTGCDQYDVHDHLLPF